MVVPQVKEAIFPDPAVSNAPRTRIRLTQRSTVAFTTRYDLLQLIPTLHSSIGGNSLTTANSDMNLDGVVNSADLEMYIEAWMEDSPAADMDMDDQVDGTDSNTFIEAYVTGT